MQSSLSSFMAMKKHRVFQKLSVKYASPRKVQKFLTTFKYNNEEAGETLRSAYSALKVRRCHCLEGAFIAAAILEEKGYPPLVLSIESQDKLDHVVYVFKERGRWGAIGRSRDNSLSGRPPVFRSLRDMVWSYFDAYIDKTGRITAYQLANLNDVDSDWRMSAKSVWKVEQYLSTIKHIKLMSSEKRYRKWYQRYLREGVFPKKSWWW